MLAQLALVAALLLVVSASSLIVVQFQSGVRDTMLVAIALVSAAVLLLAQRRRAEESQRARARTVERAVQLMDEERAEIAHRLHDGPQQLYTAIRLQAEGARHAISEGDPSGAPDALARLQALASEASEELRQMTGPAAPGGDGAAGACRPRCRRSAAIDRGAVPDDRRGAGRPPATGRRIAGPRPGAVRGSPGRWRWAAPATAPVGCGSELAEATAASWCCRCRPGDATAGRRRSARP